MKTNTNKGWIKLYRSIWDQEQSADPYWVAVWMYLLTHAAHEETEVTFKGERIKLKPGQLVVTIRSFTNAMPGLKRDRVHRLLCRMTEDCLIAKRSDKRFTFITVQEWDNYQCTVGQDSETEQEEKKKKAKRTALVADNPPSVDEIASYVEDKGLNVDSSKFWNYYDTADWTIEVNGKNPRPMKNWKTVARSWSERDGDSATKFNGENRIDYGKVMKEVKRASH
jgi:hypothetical protein